MFSYIRRHGSFFGVQKVEIQYFWGSQKDENILRYYEDCGYFLGHHKIGLYLGVISMHFRVSSQVKAQNGRAIVFWVAKI